MEGICGMATSGLYKVVLGSCLMRQGQYDLQVWLGIFIVCVLGAALVEVLLDLLVINHHQTLYGWHSVYM